MSLLRHAAVPLLLRSKTLPELEEREKKYTQEFFTTHEITAKTEDEKAELEVSHISLTLSVLCACCPHFAYAADESRKLQRHV
jgi:hypothetical protein